MVTAPAPSLQSTSQPRRAPSLRWFALSCTVAADVVLTVVSFALAYVARYTWRLTPVPHAPTVALWFTAWYRFDALLIALVITALAFAGVYRQRLSREW